MTSTSARIGGLEAWPTAGRLVVFDLEWTAWEGSLERGWTGPGEYRELIQIGAVRVDARTFHEIDAFECLVKPGLNPRLSDYIQRLTGISDAQVQREGLSFTDALSRFVDFVGGDLALYNGGDAGVLEHNCELRGAAYPWSPAALANIRPALARVTGRSEDELVSSQLPALLGFGDSCHAHTGLGDARAIARALAGLRARADI